MSQQVSINTLAEWTGRDRRTIKARLQSLNPEIVGSAHNYDSAQALTAIYIGDRPESDTVSLTEARTRESLAKALGAEIENETRLKTRIPIEIVNDANDAFFGLLKAKIMGSKMSDEDKQELIDEMREIPTKLRW